MSTPCVVEDGVPQTISPIARALFARIFPWFCVVIGGVFLYSGNQALSSTRAMADWTRTEGRVLASSVEGTPLESSRTYHPLIVYEYRLQGLVLHGTRLTSGDHAFSRYTEAQAVVNRYPVGRAVTVYYNPFSVTEAVLEPGTQWQPYVILGVGGLCILTGLCLAVVLPRTLRRRH